jgi:hypothetical protein
MNLDFSLLLVVLTAFTGLVWLVDSLLFRRRRMDSAGAAWIAPFRKKCSAPGIP